MVPLDEFRAAHAELVGDRRERVAAPHAVARQLAQIYLRARRRRNNQLLAGIERSPALDPVGVGNGRRSDAVFPRNLAERLAFLHTMAPPAYPLLRRDVRDVAQKAIRGSARQPQLIACIP